MPPLGEENSWHSSTEGCSNYKSVNGEEYPDHHVCNPGTPLYSSWKLSPQNQYSYSLDNFSSCIFKGWCLIQVTHSLHTHFCWVHFAGHYWHYCRSVLCMCCYCWIACRFRPYSAYCKPATRCLLPKTSVVTPKLLHFVIISQGVWPLESRSQNFCSQRIMLQW